MKFIYTILIALGALGCSSSTDTVTAQAGRPTFLKLAVPKEATEGACGSDPQALTLCDWVTSFDAVVVGEILEASVALDPIFINEDSGETATTAQACSGVVDPAMALRVRVLDVVTGTVTSSEIMVRIGREHAGAWAAAPVMENEAGVSWTDGSTWTHYFTPGSTVGLALTRDPDTELWSLMGEQPFTFLEDGTVVMRDLHECLATPTVTDTSYEGFIEDARGCQLTTEATTQKNYRLNTWAMRATQTVAAQCFPGGEKPDCITSSGCPHNAPCVSGQCDMEALP